MQYNNSNISLSSLSYKYYKDKHIRSLHLVHLIASQYDSYHKCMCLFRMSLLLYYLLGFAMNLFKFLLIMVILFVIEISR